MLIQIKKRCKKSQQFLYYYTYLKCHCVDVFSGFSSQGKQERS